LKDLSGLAVVAYRVWKALRRAKAAHETLWRVESAFLSLTGIVIVLAFIV
jgi:hypothetical protein